MIKHLAALATLAAAASPALALSTGDIAFTAFNADEDGWSLVSFVDIAPNTQIFFSDGTAASATTLGSGESAFSWDTGASVITAGTVVRFSAIDAAGRAASVGSFSVVNSTNLGLSATAETVYAFLGSSATAVTTMLSAVSTEATTTSLSTVGLNAGTNAIKLTSSADFAGYTGARTGLASLAAYAPLVNDAANWSINVNGDGSSVVPDTTVFAAVPEPEGYALMLAGLAGLALLRRRRA